MRSTKTKINFITVILLSLIYQVSFAQVHKNDAVQKVNISQQMDKIQREYFILGTLNDYMGRSLHPDSEDQLEAYYSTQGPLLNIIDSFLKKNYPGIPYQIEKYADKNGNLMSARINSKGLSAKFNSYYTFLPTGSRSIDNKPVLAGQLKKGLFKTETEKLAFIAGVYVTFKVKNDTTYCFNIANSTSKAEIAYGLLKDLDCNPSSRIINNIPVSHLVYFHPTTKVKTYLQQFMYISEQIDREKRLYTERILKEKKS